MRIFVLITAALVLFGGGSTLAQQLRSAPTRKAPASRMTSPIVAPATSLATVPGTIRARGASPLGAIGFTSGTAATISAGAIGSVMTCPTTGIGAAAPSTAIDASNAVGTSGALSPQPLPGATLLPNPSFGISIMTGACNPATIAQKTAEFFNNTEVVPIPGLATITGAAFSDATIPSAATEAGDAGLSPEIVVPTPDSSAAP